jgi:hypothetical protein
MKASADEGTIGTFRGKAHYKSPLLSMPIVSVFCTGKLQGGQDLAFPFRGGLANYEAHYDLSWFRCNTPGVTIAAIVALQWLLQ